MISITVKFSTVCGAECVPAAAIGVYVIKGYDKSGRQVWYVGEGKPCSRLGVHVGGGANKKFYEVTDILVAVIPEEQYRYLKSAGVESKMIVELLEILILLKKERAQSLSSSGNLSRHRVFTDVEDQIEVSAWGALNKAPGRVRRLQRFARENSHSRIVVCTRGYCPWTFAPNKRYKWTIRLP